jgi:hypothetical protein
MSFQEADRRYAELTQQRDAGILNEEEFDAQRRQLILQDDEGRWWTKLGQSGEWHYHDDSNWMPGTPPGYQEVTPQPTPEDSPVPTPSSPPTEGAGNGEDKRRKIPRWILVVGIVGIALVGIVVISWVLVPYLRGGAAPGGQGAVSAKQANPASNGAGFDAVFIQHATSENISANSTYIDNSLTNANPNAVLYVTQNWNPGGNAGTYNNHPVGVWYDPARQRWAIFNQDREAMPEGAAFNVAVLRETTEAK